MIYFLLLCQSKKYTHLNIMSIFMPLIVRIYVDFNIRNIIIWNVDFV